MAERVGISAKQLTIAMMVAVTIGIVALFWALLHSAYNEGVAVGFIGLHRLAARIIW